MPAEQLLPYVAVIKPITVAGGGRATVPSAHLVTADDALTLAAPGMLAFILAGDAR